MFLDIKMDEKEMGKGKWKVTVLKVPSFTVYPSRSLAISIVSQARSNHRSAGSSFLSLKRLGFSVFKLLDLTIVSSSHSCPGQWKREQGHLSETWDPERTRVNNLPPTSRSRYDPETQVLPSTPLPRPYPVQHHAAPPPQIFFPKSRQCGIVIRYKLKVYFLPFSNYTALW